MEIIRLKQEKPFITLLCLFVITIGLLVSLPLFRDPMLIGQWETTNLLHNYVWEFDNDGAFRTEHSTMQSGWIAHNGWLRISNQYEMSIFAYEVIGYRLFLHTGLVMVYAPPTIELRAID